MDRIEKLKEFMAASPDDSFIQHALALEYIKAGRDEEARVLFEQLLGRDENYIGSYYHMARLLERTGKTGDAISWYEKGIRKAKEKGDLHACNELQAAYDDLIN